MRIIVYLIIISLYAIQITAAHLEVKDASNKRSSRSSIARVLESVRASLTPSPTSKMMAPSSPLTIKLDPPLNPPIIPRHSSLVAEYATNKASFDVYHALCRETAMMESIMKPRGFSLNNGRLCYSYNAPIIPVHFDDTIGVVAGTLAAIHHHTNMMRKVSSPIKNLDTAFKDDGKRGFRVWSATVARIYGRSNTQFEETAQTEGLPYAVSRMLQPNASALENILTMAEIENDIQVCRFHNFVLGNDIVLAKQHNPNRLDKKLLICDRRTSMLNNLYNGGTAGRLIEDQHEKLYIHDNDFKTLYDYFVHLPADFGKKPFCLVEQKNEIKA